MKKLLCFIALLGVLVVSGAELIRWNGTNKFKGWTFPVNCTMIREDGLLVLEHGKDNHFEDDPHFIERRVYGSVNFSFFKATVQKDE